MSAAGGRRFPEGILRIQGHHGLEGGEAIATVLSVLLFILKWLGILLLGLLGILILLLLLICLVPVRYQIKGRYAEQLRAKADVTWLLHLIHVWLGAINTQILCKIKVLGHCFKKLHIGSWGEEEKEEAGEEAGTVSKEEAARKKKEARKEKEKKEKKEKEKAAEKEIDSEKKKEKEKKEPPPKKDKYDRLFEALEKKEKRKEAEKAGKAAEAEEEEKQALPEKVRHLYREFQIFWEDEKNRDAVELIKRQLLKLGKHLMPTHFLLEGDVGLSDPAATGELLGKFYRFYPLYGDHIRLNGVFDRQTVNVYTEIKGRLRIGVLVEVVIRLLLNKRCRQWLKKMMKKKD